MLPSAEGTDIDLSLVVKHLGIDAAREATRKRVLDVKFEPKNTELSEPKHGKEEHKNKPHEGGNTWAGGVSFYFTPTLQIMALTSGLSVHLSPRLEVGTRQGWEEEEVTNVYTRAIISSRSPIN